MPVEKKLVAVGSLLAIGMVTAFFFRKDASPEAQRQEASRESLFDDPVERRANDARLAKNLAPRRALAPKPEQVLRVPSATTASIPEPKTADDQPGFQKTFNPVGALLAPIEAPVDALEEADAQDHLNPLIEPSHPDSPLTHRIVDGDTLSKLAGRYLGRGDRYVEIFELNRDVLVNADLLPIGTVLRIPPRRGSLRIGPPLSHDEQPAPPLEDIPKRPGLDN